MMGRTSGNKVVVFQSDSARPGDYVNVTITRSTSATLIGNIASQYRFYEPQGGAACDGLADRKCVGNI